MERQQALEGGREDERRRDETKTGGVPTRRGRVAQEEGDGSEARCGGEDNGERAAMPADGGGGNGAVPGSALGRGRLGPVWIGGIPKEDHVGMKHSEGS